MTTNSPRVLYFTSSTCRICTALTPFVDEVSDEFRDQVELVRVAVDREPEIAVGHAVRGVPTLIAITAGKETDRAVGAKTPAQLRRFFAGAASGTAAAVGLVPRERAIRILSGGAIAVIGVMAAQPLVIVAGGVVGVAGIYDLFLARFRA